LNSIFPGKARWQNWGLIKLFYGSGAVERMAVFEQDANNRLALTDRARGRVLQKEDEFTGRVI
jgi:hypothetical protein